MYEETMVKFLLENADCVIYVISPDGREDEEQMFFDSFVPVAGQMRKSWERIPWILVLNKSDRGTHSNLENLFPEELRAAMIRTNARIGDGVPELLERVDAVRRSLTRPNIDS